MSQILVSNIFGIAGTIVSIIGLIIAIIQSMKYKAANENYKKLKQIRNTQIWGSISLILEAYDTLDEAKKILEEREIDSEISLKIVSARKSIVAQYLRLLEQAILDEPTFTIETANEWRKKGLLENEWRYQVAIKLSQDKSKLSEHV
jgi:hypothetical protein